MRVFTVDPLYATALRLKPHSETGERPIFTPMPYHRLHRAYTGKCPDLLHRRPATGQATELTRHAGSRAPALTSRHSAKQASQGFQHTPGSESHRAGRGQAAEPLKPPLPERKPRLCSG